MAEIQGLTQTSQDAERDYATKVKPQYHRPGQNFRMEGFIITMNKADQVDGVDYTALTESTMLSVNATAGDTTITVSDPTMFAKSRTVTITDGSNMDIKTIQNIVASTKVITLNSALVSSYDKSNTTVKMDRLTVSYANKVTTINYIVGGQNATPTLCGFDVQYALVDFEDGKSFSNFDRCEARVIVPYWTGASWIDVSATWMVKYVYLLNGTTEFRFDSHESATAIDPNYIIRIKFTSGEATPIEKKLSVIFGTWRA